MLNFLLIDNESLESYLAGTYVGFGDLKRRMFLLGRSQDRSIPDIHYQLKKDLAFADCTSLSEVFTKGLTKLAAHYLLVDKNHLVCIKAEEQNNWQELLTYIPPLLLQSLRIHANVKPDHSDLKKYFEKHVLPNTKYTAMPSAHIPSLEGIVSANDGLHDLHMHLNGSMETDTVWQDYLYQPELVHRELELAFGNEKVREQFEQESTLLGPFKFLKILKIAQRLRFFFYDFLYPSSTPSTTANKQQLLSNIILGRTHYTMIFRHPFVQLIGGNYQYPHLVSIESLMHILILEHIDRSGNEMLAGLFHFYLLILGLTNRLLVQQVHQNGFEQFQKHTLNGLRENSEKTYFRRFLQLHGNGSRNLNFLEGRFSPKDKEVKMDKMLTEIFRGWNQMKSAIAGSSLAGLHSFDDPQLNLVAHFIKTRDSIPALYVRHKKLRYELIYRAKLLVQLLKRNKSFREHVVAIDAAANEFDAPPEVFAPTFRLMRREGIAHFTYHAGEDFCHLSSGFRAVYEAISFCGLVSGDRIGHATALGISARQWTKVVGKNILITIGEDLDNHVFLYYLITTYRIEALMHLLKKLAKHIASLSKKVYEENLTAQQLIDAWLLRSCCPSHGLKRTIADAAAGNFNFDKQEWQYVLDHPVLFGSHPKENNDAWKIYAAYHEKNVRKRYDLVHATNTTKVLSLAQLSILQLEMLKIMSNKKIIIETLPTSNVRIGFHKNYSTYHLANWIRWRQDGHDIPPIIIGTDDAGIFATNIYNEYANIYSLLKFGKRISEVDVITELTELNNNSINFRFT